MVELLNHLQLSSLAKTRNSNEEREEKEETEEKHEKKNMNKTTTRTRISNDLHNV